MAYTHEHQFTKEECYFLIDNHKNFSAKQLAEMMSTMFSYPFTINQIKNKLYDLQLMKGNQNNSYTSEMIEWLIERFNIIPLKDLVIQFNETFNTNKTLSGIWHKLNRIVDGGIVKADTPIVHTKWTNEMVEWLKTNYDTDSYPRLAIKINELFNVNCTSSSVEHKCNRLGLTKSKEAISKISRRNSAFWFKKGQPCIFKKPLGYERITKSGYTWVKIAEPDVFKAKHRLIWEQHNGAIPPGYKVIFADGDKTNFDISNLILVSNSELAPMNKLKLIKKGNGELTKIGHLITKINLKVKEVENAGKKHSN